jgi:hypothetical protein
MARFEFLCAYSCLWRSLLARPGSQRSGALYSYRSNAWRVIDASAGYRRWQNSDLSGVGELATMDAQESTMLACWPSTHNKIESLLDIIISRYDRRFENALVAGRGTRARIGGSVTSEPFKIKILSNLIDWKMAPQENELGAHAEFTRSSCR